MGSDIRTLAVELPGVVEAKKHIKNHFTGYQLRVELHFYGFGMPRSTGADCVVGGIDCRSPGITGHHVSYARKGAVDRIEAPKASTSNYEFFHG